MSLELIPTTVSSDGRAVAREPSGRVVFVEGALPGEKVLVDLVTERSKSARGRLEEVIEPSPHRVAPPCPEVERGCGGCTWQHVSVDEQRRLKVEIVTNALRRSQVEPPAEVETVELAPWAYRTTLRLGVVEGRAGFRMKSSHEVLQVAGCAVAHPLLIDLLTEGRYRGAEEVILRCGPSTGERMVDTAPAGVPIDVPAGVRRDHYHEHAAGRLWRISAGSFFQSRTDGAEALARLVEQASEESGAPGMAIDLYSGVGLFAGVLAEKGWRVAAVESAASAARDARSNLRGLEARVVRADVGTWTPDRAGLVVADPNRRGLGRRGAEVAAASGAPRVILVSCDAIGLARDASLLAQQGYELTGLTLVDMFPHTFHIEAVSVFDRL